MTIACGENRKRNKKISLDINKQYMSHFFAVYLKKNTSFYCDMRTKKPKVHEN